MPSKHICQHIPINTYHCNNYQTTPTSPHLPGNTCLSQCQHLPVYTPACSHIYLFMTSCQYIPVHTPTCPHIHLFMTSCQHPSCTNMSMYLPVHDFWSTSTCEHTNLSIYLPVHTYLSVCELAGRDWSSTSLWAVFTCRMSVTSRVYLRWQWPHDHTSCESSECT